MVCYCAYISSMTTEKGTKINQLLKNYPDRVVYLSSWLEAQGINSSLQKDYRKNGWLESIGTGAMARQGIDISINDGIQALQQQSPLNIHIGGRTALSLHGSSHYLEMGKQQVYIFAKTKTKLPKWFREYKWQADIKLSTTMFLPAELGIVKVNNINISTPTRALMECLHLAPSKFDLMECYQLMEGLNNLLPTDVQELLNNCSSIKIKRLFLYMAEKAEHTWFEYLDLKKIDLGKGKRSLVENGVYNAKYKISVPREVAEA